MTPSFLMKPFCSPRLGTALALSALVLAGCASAPSAHPQDPFESYNRSMSRFNDAVDEAVLKPVATGYQQAVPELARRGVSNFFANLGDAWSFVNNTLQWRGEAAMSSFFRFGINTVFGLGGVLDIATEMRLERHKQDFGLTLGRWGVPPGPYLVLPLLGPSTVRDTLAWPVDSQGNLLKGVDDIPSRNSLYALRLVDTRANFLRAGEMLDGAALDKYSFSRDVFLRVRSQRAGIDRDMDRSAADEAADGSLPPEPEQ
ncbi:MAG: VacJ family lipoprotein [Giesbergeria sp.]|uniref:MlaA family lipoprotein n=1 Tax=Giesbergeria sp. TaxID=2818473 RepID=UPI0026322962|nr:VacJ family lipoprotein [Giesbergeria sp.]MDD2609268.1 VacJ family lipoprotein [Giesbergeria sp.]